MILTPGHSGDLRAVRARCATSPHLSRDTSAQGVFLDVYAHAQGSNSFPLDNKVIVCKDTQSCSMLYFSSHNQIRRYRMKRGLSQKEVAWLLGQRIQAHVSHWERGRKGITNTAQAPFV